MKKIRDRYLIHPELTVNLHNLRFPLEYLHRGLLVVGQPGAGKSLGIIMPLIQEILRVTSKNEDTKACLIVADPKNELAPFLTKACAACGRSDDLVILAPGSAFYNPLGSPFFTDNETVEKIISFANNTHRSGSRMSRGDEMFWANAQRSLLGALVAIARVTRTEGLNFASLSQTWDDIHRLGSKDKVGAWLTKRDINDFDLRAIGDYFALPETTRACVATSVVNTLHFWRSEPLAQLTTPTKGRLEIDPFEIIDQGKILVIGCSSAAFGVSISPLLLALKEHFFTTLLSRDQIEMTTDDEWVLINQSRPVFFIADEFASYLTPDSSAGELVALDRLRGFHAGYIAATQNVASIHSVLGGTADATRLIALFSNQIYMANTCPYTASQASWIMGSKPQKPTGDCVPMAPPLLAGYREKRVPPKNRDDSFARPRVEAATLSAMKTGEFWARLANGQVVKGKAKF
jgi:hypothetical protein